MSVENVMQIVVLTATAVWTVATIRNTTQNLNDSIKSLARTVENLSASVGKIQTKSIDHEARIRVVEKQMGNWGDGA
jgi:hypothetical protein